MGSPRFFSCRLWIVAALLPGWACVVSAEEAAWWERRSESDRLFRAELDRLADRCDELQLAREARVTRAWIIDRDPARQYLFLPPAASPASPIEQPSEASRYWWRHFLDARARQAQRLVDLARELARERPDGAFQLLHEALREDPDLQIARDALGYRRNDEGWTYAGDVITSSVGRGALREYGFESGQYVRIDSPNFRIVTDADEATGRKMARELEDLHCVWRQVFYEYWGDGPLLARRLEKGAPDARPRVDKHRIVWFRDREGYLRALGKDQPQIEKTLGIYLDQRRVVYLYGDPDQMRSTWMHEVTHQLFAETGRTVPDLGQAGNVWVVEGLALYMESLAWRDGYATLGGFDAPRLQYARYRAFVDKFYVPAHQFAQLDRRTMQSDPNIGRLYSQAAGWATYFMNGRQGRWRPAFIRYVTAVYRGRDQADSLTRHTGLAWEDIDRGYAKFLQVTDDDIRDSRPVRELVLSHTFVTGRGLSRIPVEELEWLDIGFTSIDDQGIAHLANASKLKRLTLEHTRVTSAGLDPILSCSELEYLDLSGLPIGDDVLPKLAGLARLESLWLTDTQVTDAGLQHLKKLKRLKTLDVTGTQVTASGLADLQSVLPGLNPP